MKPPSLKCFFCEKPTRVDCHILKSICDLLMNLWDSGKFSSFDGKKDYGNYIKLHPQFADWTWLRHWFRSWKVFFRVSLFTWKVQLGMIPSSILSLIKTSWRESKVIMVFWVETKFFSDGNIPMGPSISPLVANPSPSKST